MCSSPTTCRRKLVLGSSGKAQRTSAWTGGPFRAASISRTWALRPLPTTSLERPGTATPQAKQQEAVHPAPRQQDPRARLGDAAGRGPAAARTAGRGWCRHGAFHDTLPGSGLSAPAEAAPSQDTDACPHTDPRAWKTRAECVQAPNDSVHTHCRQVRSQVCTLARTLGVPLPTFTPRLTHSLALTHTCRPTCPTCRAVAHACSKPQMRLESRHILP